MKNRKSGLLSAVACASVALSCAATDLDFTGIFPASVKCVSIVAPSSHADNTVVETATNELVKVGYKVKVMDSVWTYSSDPAVRARDIERAWQDLETDLILCSRGGSGGWDTVTNLNFEILKSRDVPFIGFSNISTLMNAFLAKGVKRPITGPMCTSLVNYPTSADSIARLAATVARADLDDTQLTVRRAPTAAVSGKPVGGHWPSINTMSADWLPDTTGRIAFLEISSGYTVDTAKTQFDSLKNKGYFASVAAIVLCDIGITGTTEEKEEVRQHIIDAVTCPVFSGYPYGHVKKLYAIDYDRTLTISTDGLLSWEKLGGSLGSAGDAATGTEGNDIYVDAAAGATETVTPGASTANVFVNTQGGSGTVRFNDAASYAGGLTLGAGTLEAAALGLSGAFTFTAGTFRYTGTESASWAAAVALGTGTCIFESDADVTATGKWTQNSEVSFKKNGSGTLAFSASGNKLGGVVVHAGTLAITGGKTTFENNANINDSVGGGEANRTRLVVSGGTHSAENIYVGQNSVKNGEYWADFIMTGGSLTTDSGTSLFLGNRDKAHVTADISGGVLTLGKNFGVAYNTTENVDKFVDVIIRDNAVVRVGGGAANRFYFDGQNSTQSRFTLTVKDGGTVSAPYICRYDGNAVYPIVLFDGGNIIWQYDLSESAYRYRVFRGSLQTLGTNVFVGTKGVSFTGGKRTFRFDYTVPLVATNTVPDLDPVGVSFVTGQHVLTTENSWAGPTRVAGDAELVLGKNATLPLTSVVTVEGALVVTGGVKQVAVLTLNGRLDLVQDAPLEVGEIVQGGVMSALNLYTTADRAELVSAAGTYPVLTAPASSKDALKYLAAATLSGNGGYFTVTEAGGVATMSLVLGSYPTQQQPACRAEGTNDASTVEFRCLGEVETVDGVVYLKPGTVARLSAVDTTGGLFATCWRDETTGDLFWGDDAVAVTPTNHTVYTAIFGKAWCWDATAKTLSDGDWTFAAILTNDTEIIVDRVSVSPDHGILNLSTPVTNAAGQTFTLVAAGRNVEGKIGVLGVKADHAHRQKLKTLYLGGHMISVGYGAFQNCSNLTSNIITPPRLKTVFPYAFDSNVTVKDVRIEAVTVIGKYAFRHCNELVTVRLAKDLRIIERYAFNENPKLTHVTPFLPDTVEDIGRAAFYINRKLEGDLRLASAKRVCYSAFCSTKITSIYVPAVTNIGARTFEGIPATNYVFGAHQVNFLDEETGKGHGYSTFKSNNSLIRHFWFPGLAPNLPAYKSDATGVYEMFGGQSGKSTVILHGSWRKDRDGWSKILSEIGSTDLTGKERPALRADDRAIRGVFRWYGNGSYQGSYGWLVDTAMPNEPPPLGTLLMFR